MKNRHNGNRVPTWTELRYFFSIWDTLMDLKDEMKYLSETKFFARETKHDLDYVYDHIFFPMENQINAINSHLIKYRKDLRKFTLNAENLENPSEDLKLEWDPWDSKGYPLDLIDIRIPFPKRVNLPEQSLIHIKSLKKTMDSAENPRFFKMFFNRPDLRDLILILKNEIEDINILLDKISNPNSISNHYLFLIHQRVKLIQSNFVKISKKMPPIEKKSRLKKLIELCISVNGSISNKFAFSYDDLFEIQQTTHSISSNLRELQTLSDNLPATLWPTLWPTLWQLRSQSEDLRANIQKIKTASSVLNNNLFHIKQRLRLQLRLQGTLLFEIQKELDLFR